MNMGFIAFSWFCAPKVGAGGTANQTSDPRSSGAMPAARCRAKVAVEGVHHGITAGGEVQRIGEVCAVLVGAVPHV